MHLECYPWSHLDTTYYTFPLSFRSIQFIHLLLLPWLHFDSDYFGFDLLTVLSGDLYVELNISTLDYRGERILFPELFKDFFGILIKILLDLGWLDLIGGFMNFSLLDWTKALLGLASFSFSFSFFFYISFASLSLLL